ncbi:MAG TPA: helix-turn-helix domain-containing protein [Urbifossiella sp.]|jgi:excisionase family DNA binding protein|nr:helix-turn-helix domain-containing protein [Urbifossiella sp.]
MKAASQSRREDLAADGAVSVAEACVFLGLGVTEMYAMMGRGELPYAKLGRRRLIPRKALVALLLRHMTVVG